MPFDLESARKEASDTEIAEFLSGKIDFDLKSARSESSDTEIAEFLSGKIDDNREELGLSDLPANIIPSAKEFASNILQAVIHPIRTADTIRDVVIGGLATAVDPIGSPEEEMFNNVVDFFKERFGSVEKIKQTAITDPVGFASDVALALTGIGGAVRTAGQAGKVGQVARTGEVISRVGRAIEPVRVAGKAIETVAKLRTPVNTLIKTALQLPKKTGIERVDELANAFLDKGLNVNRRSLKILDSSIRKSQRAINNIVDKKTAQGIVIKTDDIVKSLDDLVANARKEGLELPDLKTIERMRGQFLEANGATLTPRQVQDLKVGFNKGFKPNLESRFGQVRNKVRDSLRNSAKSELEKLHPQLKELNKGQGVDLELNKAITDRIKALEKSPTVPSKGLIGGGLAGGFAGASAESLATGLTFAVGAFTAVEIISNPKVQVVLAKALHAANLKLARAGRLADITQPAFQAGRVAEQAEPQITR